MPISDKSGTRTGIVSLTLSTSAVSVVECGFQDLPVTVAVAMPLASVRADCGETVAWVMSPPKLTVEDPPFTTKVEPVELERLAFVKLTVPEPH